MPSFSTEVPHTLGQAEAQQKLESFLQKIIERYKDQVSDIKGDWLENVLDFSMTTYGINIKGKLAVEEDKVRMDGELPFAAMMFKGKITNEITEALQKALA
ncbi:MAG: polyhydroxyalkanoic acid system family protein [Planctomycetales bacterium]|nr:polyhydroxyalkanoic acid system family protein [Planctomycetales bacterium]